MLIVYQGAAHPVVISLAEWPAPDETEPAFRARMIATCVPPGASHLIDPVLPTGIPPERWAVDWQAGTITDAGLPVATLRSTKIVAAWVSCAARCEAASVEVTTSAGAHLYGVDAITRDNISNALLGVVAGLVPNPRPWTPKGAAMVLLTHDDIRLVAGTIGAAYDAHIQAYLSHKAALVALTTAAGVDAYDITTGWPG